MTDPVISPRGAAQGLRAVALVKQVPLDGGSGDLDPDGRLRRTGQDAEMNPWCRRAVTQAVRLAAGPGGHSTAVTMGPPRAVDVLREALACGVQSALHLTDPGWAGADCLVTAKALAAALEAHTDAEVILVGRSSVDGNTTAIGPMVAELLGLPFIGAALDIDVAEEGGARVLRATLQSEEGRRTVRVALPAVVAVAERSCRGAKAPSDIWPGTDRIRTVSRRDLGHTGPVTSPTRVTGARRQARVRTPVVLSGTLDEQVEQALDLWESRTEPDAAAAGEPVPPRHRGTPFERVLALTGPPETAEPRALLGEAAGVAVRFGAGVIAVVLPGADTRGFGAWGADELLVLSGDAPRSAAAALHAWIIEHDRPHALLSSARSWEREVLGRLAVRLDSGLMSDLVAVEARDDGLGPRLVGTKPSGQSALAEIDSLSSVQIATLRTGSLPLRTPRPGSGPLPMRQLDVPPDPALRAGPLKPDANYDALERARVVIGVGQGVDPGRYAELEPLRLLLDAELAATRKVTDTGRLPHSRQLGVTARAVAPELYLALGISGSTNHMSGVERAATVLAVNHDAGALVFERCDIGIVADWAAAVEALCAALDKRRRLTGGLRGERGD
ncbi:FAD-binding protein [Streptomyces chiangmaiensis]|uniref:Electron transfer flavoprotein small subunit n=1 Tax=Streptomyces chiangmaiensis TaxID=766497 RepID=A0ABU7FIN8_9ACTN|nr:FAD-binding protein [Streptomyces chiangmaiensis]MED7823997.1 FAD-binding protein [Streptomyces chiangmaiensis]